MTPLVLRLALLRSPSALHTLRRLAPELALYVLVVIGALWIIVGAQPATDFKFFYLLFVPVVLIAVRHGLDGACRASRSRSLASWACCTATATTPTPSRRSRP